MKQFKLLLGKYKESSRRKKVFIILVLIGFILVSGGLGYFVASNLVAVNRAFSSLGILISGAPREPRNFPNSINGVLFTNTHAKKWKDRLTLAVVIENHVYARPHSGLSNADFVYEVFVEGGINRLLGICMSEDGRLRPVLSTLPDFVDWTC